MFFKKQTVSKWNKVLGFSIMEVMISMFVLSAGIVAVIQLFSSGFINSAADRDRIVAAGLAQEGLEIVKNIRDNTLVIPGNLGFEGFSPVLGNDLCALDYTDHSFINIGSTGSKHNCFPSSGDSQQKFSLMADGSGFFSNPYNTDATSTKWARAIYIVYTQDVADKINDSAEVTSVVWWGGSASWPFPGGAKPTSGNLSRCTASARCVFATMHLNTWKP